jgi:hypothetical protein
MESIKVSALTSTLAFVAGICFVSSAVAGNSTSKSRDYTVGKPTQNVKPREMKETMRPDGSRSIVTGQKRDANGKIVGPHSHSVTRDGKVEYSRTSGGKVVKDNRASAQK